MKNKGIIAIVSLLLLTVFLSGCGKSASTTPVEKKEIKIGATAGPYSDQVKNGIKPILEKKGYKVTIVEFNDYIQPNIALAEGSFRRKRLLTPNLLRKV